MGPEFHGEPEYLWPMETEGESRSLRVNFLIKEAEKPAYYLLKCYSCKEHLVLPDTLDGESEERNSKACSEKSLTRRA